MNKTVFVGLLVALLLRGGLYFYRTQQPIPPYTPARITWTEEDEARADRAAEERNRGHVHSELRRIREELETLKSGQERHHRRDRLRSY